MRNEIEDVRAILQRTAAGAKTYHEQIAHVRNTCKPEVIMQETKPYAAALSQLADKAKEEITSVFSGLEKSIKSKMVISAKDYNKDTVELVKLLSPDTEELEAIAQQFAGNETMLRFFQQYNNEHELCASLPVSGADRLKALRLMQGDIAWGLDIAGRPTSEENRYGDACLQSFAENFEKVFEDRIEIIGG